MQIENVKQQREQREHTHIHIKKQIKINGRIFYYDLNAINRLFAYFVCARKCRSNLVKRFYLYKTRVISTLQFSNNRKVSALKSMHDKHMKLIRIEFLFQNHFGNCLKNGPDHSKITCITINDVDECVALAGNLASSAYKLGPSFEIRIECKNS